MSMDTKTFRRALRENGLVLNVWYAEGGGALVAEVLDIKTRGLGRGFLGRHIARMSPGTRLSVYDQNYRPAIDSAIAKYDQIKETRTKVQEASR